MKKILSLLSILVASTPFIPTNSNATNFNKNSVYGTAKFTDLNEKGTPVLRLSDSTGILRTDSFGTSYFDASKINESNKGIISLSKGGKFEKLSETTALMKQTNTNQAYYFDSTKINDSSKGFIDLGKKIYVPIFALATYFYRWSNTIATFIEEDTQDFYLFDTTKVNEPNKGLINLGPSFSNFFRLSDSTAIVNKTDGSYYFDRNNLSEPNKGLIKLSGYGSFFRLSDTSGMITSTNESVYSYFDSTKINEPNKGLVPLNKKGKFSRMSDTSAVFMNEEDAHPYYFDSTKINEPNKGFTDLNITLDFGQEFGGYDGKQNKNFTNSNYDSLFESLSRFYSFISNFSGIIRDDNNTYYFDSTKINEENKGIIELNKNPFNWESGFSRLSSVSGILTTKEPYESYYFDIRKINEESKGFIKLEKQLLDFTRLSDTSGLFDETGTRELYYFEHS